MPASASSDSIIGRINSAWRRGAISLRSIYWSPTSNAAEHASVAVSIASSRKSVMAYMVHPAANGRAAP
jgi:hypothetical protein